MHHDGAVGAGSDLTLVGLISAKQLVHNAVAVGVRQELAAVADQPAGGNFDLQVGHAGGAGVHVLNLAFVGAQFLHHGAYIGLRHFNDGQFHRLQGLAGLGILFQNDLGTADGEFIVLSPHGLNENGQVQLTSAGYLKGVHTVRFFHPHGHVGLHFLKQAVPQVAGGDILALTPGKGRIVDHKVHADGGLINLYKGQRLHALRGAQGLADVQVRNTGHANQVAHDRFLYRHPLQPLKLVQFGNPDVFPGIIPAAQHIGCVDFYAASLHTAHADTAHIVIIFQRGEQYLGGTLRVALGRWNVL